MGCELCDFPFSHRHRIKPGRWGGKYVPENLIDLCPNHHIAIHHIMKWFHKGRLKTEAEDDQLMHYFCDRELMAFWADTVKVVVIQRMVDEGRWHPYVRTLPADRKKPNRRRRA